MYLALTAPRAEITEGAVSLSAGLSGIVLVCLLLSIVLGVIISINIGKPISGITAVIRQTADLNFKRLKNGEKLTKRKDETGMMACAVGDMRKVFRSFVSDITETENGYPDRYGQAE